MTSISGSTVIPTAGPSVRVRAPAKINLYLAVGDVRDDGYHDLVTVFHAVDLADEVTVRPARRSAVRTTPPDGVPAGRQEPGRRRRPAAGQPQPRRVARSPSRSPSRSRWPAGWPAAARTPPPRWSAAPRSGAWTWPAGAGRRSPRRSAPTCPSRWPAAPRVGTGRGDLLSPVLARARLHWVLAISDRGLSTPAVFAELDRLRAQSGPPRVEAGRHHAGRAGQRRAGDDRRRTGQRPAGRRHLAAAGAASHPAGRASRRARWAGWCPGPVRRSRCSARTRNRPAAVAAELAGSGTCRSVRVAAGPAPGARVVPTGGRG